MALFHRPIKDVRADAFQGEGVALLCDVLLYEDTEYRIGVGDGNWLRNDHIGVGWAEREPLYIHSYFSL